MATTFCAGLLSLVQVPILTDFFAGIASAILDFNIATINFFGSQTNFLITVDPGYLWVFWLYLPVILLLTWTEIRKIKRRQKLYLENKLVL